MHTYIRDAAARAIFVSAWAAAEEERGRTYSGEELMDVAPAASPEAEEAADKLLDDLETVNGESVEDLLVRAADADGDDSLADDSGYAEDFGHYLGMMALGHGVSWFDDHVKFKIKVPHIEFHDGLTRNPEQMWQVENLLPPEKRSDGTRVPSRWVRVMIKRPMSSDEAETLLAQIHREFSDPHSYRLAPWASRK